MKGGKFQNLLRVYRENRNIFNQYDYVAVWDDDITIEPFEIDRMFDTVQRFSLWISQPSFDGHSKISHRHTRNIPGVELVFTNFVEMNAPVFRRDKLIEVLNHASYDGSLAGWGMDWLYHNILGIRKCFVYAIIHSVTCTNPFDHTKPGNVSREINNLASNAVRQGQWKNVRRRYHMVQYARSASGCMRTPIPLSQVNRKLRSYLQSCDSYLKDLCQEQSRNQTAQKPLLDSDGSCNVAPRAVCEAFGSKL